MKAFAAGIALLLTVNSWAEGTFPDADPVCSSGEEVFEFLLIPEEQPELTYFELLKSICAPTFEEAFYRANKFIGTTDQFEFVNKNLAIEACSLEGRLQRPCFEPTEIVARKATIRSIQEP